jgi:NADH:ubiquinone oxidoreductase subunit 6 (subunit J)
MLLALRDPGKGLAKFFTVPQKLFALFGAALLGGEMFYLAWHALAGVAAPGDADLATLSQPATLAQALFGKFLLPFEVASVLLLAAIVGAVALTRRPKGTAAMIDAPHPDEQGGPR